jgi:hypothetical protein
MIPEKKKTLVNARTFVVQRKVGDRSFFDGDDVFTSVGLTIKGCVSVAVLESFAIAPFSRLNHTTEYLPPKTFSRTAPKANGGD